MSSSCEMSLNFLFCLLWLRHYKAKCVITRCLQEGVGQFDRRFQGKGSSLGNIFGFYKTRHILLSKSANCTVLLTVVLTQYRRVTDGQTDGIAVAIADYSTALAERRAVKRSFKDQHNFHISPQLCDEPHVTSAILFGYLTRD